MNDWKDARIEFPKEGQRVLIWDNYYNEPCVVTYKIDVDGRDTWYDPYYDNYIMINYHPYWMPLPENPYNNE